MIDLILNFIVNQKNNFKKLGIYFLHTNPPPPQTLSISSIFVFYLDFVYNFNYFSSIYDQQERKNDLK